MQKNIIYILIIVIFAILSVFGIKTIKELKATNKQLQTQINADREQNDKNIADLQVRNKELEENNAKKDILQKETNKIRQSTNDKCFNSLLDDDIIKLLVSNGIK